MNTIEISDSVNTKKVTDTDSCSQNSFDERIQVLANLFNVDKSIVSERIQSIIQKWNPEIQSAEIYNKLAKLTENDYFDQLRNNQSNAHNFNLFWHALAIVSGELFENYHQPETPNFKEFWADWVSNFRITYPHKFWLADATQTVPLIALNELQKYIDLDTKIRDLNQKPLLTSNFVRNSLYESFVPEIDQNNELIIGAKWTSPDYVEVSITSALVEIENTKDALLAITSMPASKMKLPYYESIADENSKKLDLEMYPFKAWTTAINRKSRLDYHDPRGFLGFCFSPSKSIINDLDLKLRISDSHKWQDRTGKLAFQYSCWGSYTKQGAITLAGFGHLLKCNTEFLTDLLSDKYNLVILTKLKYPDSIGHSIDATYIYDENSYAIQFISLDKSLKLKKFFPSKKQLNLIDTTEKTMSFKDRYEFITSLNKK